MFPVETPHSPHHPADPCSHFMETIHNQKRVEWIMIVSSIKSMSIVDRRI